MFGFVFGLLVYFLVLPTKKKSGITIAYHHFVGASLLSLSLEPSVELSCPDLPGWTHFGSSQGPDGGPLGFFHQATPSHGGNVAHAASHARTQRKRNRNRFPGSGELSND